MLLGIFTNFVSSHDAYYNIEDNNDKVFEHEDPSFRNETSLSTTTLMLGNYGGKKDTFVSIPNVTSISPSTTWLSLKLNNTISIFDNEELLNRKSALPVVISTITKPSGNRIKGRKKKSKNSTFCKSKSCKKISATITYICHTFRHLIMFLTNLFGNIQIVDKYVKSCGSDSIWVVMREDKEWQLAISILQMVQIVILPYLKMILDVMSNTLSQMKNFITGGPFVFNWILVI